MKCLLAVLPFMAVFSGTPLWADETYKNPVVPGKHARDLECVVKGYIAGVGNLGPYEKVREATRGDFTYYRAVSLGPAYPESIGSDTSDTPRTQKNSFLALEVRWANTLFLPSDKCYQKDPRHYPRAKKARRYLSVAYEKQNRLRAHPKEPGVTYSDEFQSFVFRSNLVFRPDNKVSYFASLGMGLSIWNQTACDSSTEGCRILSVRHDLAPQFTISSGVIYRPTKLLLLTNSVDFDFRLRPLMNHPALRYKCGIGVSIF